MKSPQERMNYIIKKLNIAKKSGGGVLLLENNMEILSNKISYFDSIEH